MSSTMTIAPTEFADLEPELKEKIFTFVSNKQLQISRRVCRSWNDIVNDSFGIKLVINNLNYKLLYSCRSANEVEFNSLTRPIIDENEKIGFIDRLRCITFRNMIVSYNFMPLLTSCPKQLLEVRFFEAIIDLPEELIEPPPRISTSLSNIQKLYFRYWNFGSSLTTILCLLNKMKFGNLKEIQVDTGTTFTPLIAFEKIFGVVDPDQDVSHPQHPLVHLIQENIRTLQLFVYGSTFSPIRFKFHSGNQQLVPQLEELVISHMFHTEYVPILSSQTRLKVLVLGSCKVESWRATRECILANASTLEKLHLRSYTFGQEWNCNVFETTTILQDLELSMNFSPKTNLQYLPLSLKFLEIDGTISKREIVKLYALKNLQRLVIVSLGINLINVIPNIEADREQRVGFEFFKLFIVKLPKLTHLSFQECTANSIYWAPIRTWCEEARENYGIHLELHFYDVQGQQVMHGLTLLIPETLDRSTIQIDMLDEEIQAHKHGLSLIDEVTDVLVACWSLFGL